MLNKLHATVFGQKFDHFILTLIVLNGIILVLEALFINSPKLFAGLKVADKIILFIFCVEVGCKLFLRMATQGVSAAVRLFREPWFLFDFVLVLMAFLPGLSALRSLRLLRLLPRYEPFKRFSEQMVFALLRSLPVLAFFLFVMFVLALIGFHAGHSAAPEQFGTLTDSMYTALFAMFIEGMPDAVTALHDVNWFVALVYLLLGAGIGHMLLLAILIGVIVDSMNILEQQKQDEFD